MRIHIATHPLDIPGPVGGRFGVTEKQSDCKVDFGTVYGNLGLIWQEVLNMD